MDWGNELLCTNCQPWGQSCWAPVAPVAGRAQGLVWDRRTPRGWSRAGVCGEIPALLLLCPSLALWGNRTYKQWSSLKLKPCKAKHEKILLFLPFLGAIAHPKKISGTWETSRARNGGGAGGWRGWQTPTVLLKNMERWEKQNLNTQMGSAAPGWDVQSIDGKAHECHQQSAEGWPQQEGFAWLYTAFSFKIQLLPWNTFTDLTIYIYLVSPA